MTEPARKKVPSVGKEAYSPPPKIKASPEGKIWTVKEARGIGTDGDVPEQGWQTLPSPLVLNPGKRGDASGGKKRRRTNRKPLKRKTKRGGFAVKPSESTNIIKIQSELVKQGSLPKGGLTRKTKRRS